MKDKNTTETKTTFDQWAKVELFGHQVIVGRVTEATIAGGAFLRVDVPAYNKEPAYTKFFGPSAIYSITPVSEDVVRALLDQYRQPPVQQYELPRLAEKYNHEEGPTEEALNACEEDCED